MIGRSPNDAFSTPWDAPLVPDFPFTFRNVEILTAFYRTDVEAVAALIPPPLEPASDLVAVHLYAMNDTEWLGVYNESAVQVDVRLPERDLRGAYSPYLFLDSDGGITAGRETYGQPKKYGRPTIDFRHDLIVGEVSRNGITFVTVTTPYKQRKASLQDARDVFDFVTNINYKVVPDAAGGVAIRQLTARVLDDVIAHECWSGPATVELRPHAQAPVHRLPVREMLEGFYWRCDFTLDSAAVIHDYLRVAAPEAAG